MSDTKDNGGPAFPRQLSKYDAREGMTLRDYFAAKAMAGICAVTGVDFGGPDGAAKAAYRIADAMLKARQQ